MKKELVAYVLIFTVLFLLLGFLLINNSITGFFLFNAGQTLNLNDKSIDKMTSNILTLNDNYNKAFSWNKGTLLKQMKDISAERKTVMLNLMKTDPQKAIDNSLSINKMKLPKDIQGNIEDATTIEGKFYQALAEGIDQGGIGGKATWKYGVVQNSVTTNVYFTKEDRDSLSEYDFGDSIQISGIKLDNTLAAGSSLAAAKPGYTTTTASITSLTLFDVNTNTDIKVLANNDVINITGKNVGMRATTDPATVYKVVFTVNGVSYTDTTIPYTTILYGLGSQTVKAVPYTSKPARSGGTSLSLTFTIFDDNKQPPKVAPTLSAVVLSSKSIKLTWNDVADETYYKLERSTSATTGFVELLRPIANTISYTDSNLSSVTTYYYRIRASNNYGDSIYSNVISGTTLAPTIPSAPTGLTTSADSPYQVTLRWTDNSYEEQGFKIERKIGTGSYTEIGSIGQDSVSFTDATVSANITYSYKVKAYNVAGQSNYSNEASITTPVGSGKYPLTSVPALSSYPSSTYKLYLDFNGAPAQTWGSYNVPITPAFDQDGDKLTFNDAELSAIRDTWAMVSEKYSPYNIDVTTIVPTSGKVMTVVIGGNGAWTGGTYGGVMYVGQYPGTAWVFEDNLASAARYIQDASSHEAGHGFGLSHQSDYDVNCVKTNEYSQGTGTDAPIMGVSYYATRGLWWNRQTCYVQDDMSKVSSSSNGYGYKADDYGNTISTASALTQSGTSLSGSGIIEKITDQDVFSFTTNGYINIQASPLVNSRPMLNIKADLINSAGTVIATSDMTTTYGSTFSLSNVTSGKYYLSVGSHSSYGDVGQYTITGTVN